MVPHKEPHKLWESFSPTGPGRLEMVVGEKKNAAIYREILKENLMET